MGVKCPNAVRSDAVMQGARRAAATHSVVESGAEPNMQHSMIACGPVSVEQTGGHCAALHA